jgi:serine phosphatase RsbU (regulator of sigma subunit)
MDSIREIEIAREVQRRLFPQRVPELQHMALAARCIQARSVGGDYYDFLDLGPDRVGLVLGDVSGKGIPAALRMANLQAYLRVLADSAPQDPLRVMRQVNRSLWQNTPAGDFATLFFGIFTDSARRLTYINCGHNPPLCLRRDGSIERLLRPQLCSEHSRNGSADSGARSSPPVTCSSSTATGSPTRGAAIRTSAKRG